MTTTLQQLLAQGRDCLAAVSTTSALDAELLLGHVLACPRSYLFAHPESKLEASLCERYQYCLAERQRGRPVAYITGRQAFWTMELRVTPAVLIPRPETELLVSLLLDILPPDEVLQIADLGTGSGAVALALASERPQWRIAASDISPAAIALAQQNAAELGHDNVSFFTGNWCEPLTQPLFHGIVANPPYVAVGDPEMEPGVLRFEPQEALIAAENGLSAIKCIAAQAKSRLVNEGVLVLEHGYRQREAVAAILMQHGYQGICCKQDLAGHYRATVAFSDEREGCSC